jgi:hypothetical protein
MTGQRVGLAAMEDGLHTGSVVRPLVDRGDFLGCAIDHDVRVGEQVGQIARDRKPRSTHRLCGFSGRRVNRESALRGHLQAIVVHHIRDAG